MGNEVSLSFVVVLVSTFKPSLAVNSVGEPSVLCYKAERCSESSVKGDTTFNDRLIRLLASLAF